MKVPKGFVYFLLFTQGVLTLGHVAFYKALLFFFPSFSAYHKSLFVALMLLSVSFLALTFILVRWQNLFLRISYVLAGVWAVTWFYFMLATTVACVVLLIFPSVSRELLQALFLVSALLSAYGVVNARVIRTKNIRVKLPNLPEYWKGKSAALVTDIHLGEVLNVGFAKRVLVAVSKLQSDIVFIPGDFYDGMHKSFHTLANVFKDFKSQHGTFFVSGNHELYSGYERCEEAIRDAGIKILENQKIEIQGLQIAGVAYASETGESLRNILQSLNLDRTTPSILLKHVPSHVDVVEQSGISLMLSGHTHLGQIWPFRYITHRIFKGFDYGLKRLKNLQVYTSSGVGTWGPPVRIFTPSEIVKITFE